MSTPSGTGGYSNTGFNGSGLTNYNGQQQTGNQQFNPTQTIGWGDQRLSVGGPDPSYNMPMAARNAPGAPPWLQQQMAGYYAAPFMTANGTSDFPRWGQSPMSYNPQYNPQQQPYYPPQGQPQQPQQPSNPYSPTQSAPNAPAPQPQYPQRTATPQQIASGNIYGFTPEQLARTPAGLFGPDPRLG
jgi:hypothetical protein